MKKVSDSDIENESKKGEVNDSSSKGMSGETYSEKSTKFTSILADNIKHDSIKCKCHLYNQLLPVMEFFMTEHDLSITDLEFLLDIKRETYVSKQKDIFYSTLRKVGLNLPNFIFSDVVKNTKVIFDKLDSFLSREHISIAEAFTILEVLRDTIEYEV